MGLLLLADMTAQAGLGPEAAMQPSERSMLEGPLTRTLKSHGHVARAALQYSDLVSLVIGLAFWLKRLAGISAKDAARKAESKRQTVPVPPAPARGEPPVYIRRPAAAPAPTSPEPSAAAPQPQPEPPEVRDALAAMQR